MSSSSDFCVLYTGTPLNTALPCQVFSCIDIIKVIDGFTYYCNFQNNWFQGFETLFLNIYYFCVETTMTKSIPRPRKVITQSFCSIEEGPMPNKVPQKLQVIIHQGGNLTRRYLSPSILHSRRAWPNANIKYL